MMKLQLWTTDANDDVSEFLGEIDVSDEDWNDAQSSGADAMQMIQDLAVEIDGGCS